MANRVGTYLSDEAIRRHCPAAFPPPMGHTATLFLTPTAERGYLPQRPQNPLKMMAMLSKLQGVPFVALREKYLDSLRQTSNQLQGVIDAPAIRHPAPAMPVPVASRPQIVSIPKSLLGGPNPPPLPNLFSSGASTSGSVSAASASASTQLSQALTQQQLQQQQLAGLTGNLGSFAQQEFNNLTGADQNSFYQELFASASVAGVDFKGTGLSYAKIQQAGKKTGESSRLFGQLEAQIYQVLGSVSGQQVIDENLNKFGLLPVAQGGASGSAISTISSPPQGAPPPSPAPSPPGGSPQPLRSDPADPNWFEGRTIFEAGGRGSRIDKSSQQLAASGELQDRMAKHHAVHLAGGQGGKRPLQKKLEPPWVSKSKEMK